MAQTTMYAGHVNSPYTLLSAGISDSADTIPVLELGVFPAAPNIAVIGTGSDAETIYYGAKSAATGAGNLTSVTREWNKTGTYGAKKAWLAGTVISRRFTEYDHATFKANIEDLETRKISKEIVDAKGDLIVGTAADTVSRLAVGTNGYPLVAKSGATAGMAWEPLTEQGISLSDTTLLDVSAERHGFVPKAPNDTSKYLRGDGTWAALGTPDVLIFKGTIDCSGNPNYPAADAGHTYLVSAAGKIGGSSGPNVEAGDMLVCCVDGSESGDHATVGANWSILQSVVTETNLTLADVTTNDASTTKHGFAPKATAPSSGIRNVLAIDNGETAYKCAELFDNTDPEPVGTASPGTSLISARRDHVHPNYTSSGVGIGIGKGSAPSYLLEIKGTSTTDLPTFSDEFLDGDNWTSTGWTGSWASGWTHTTGNTNVLSHDHPAVSGTYYQITYTVTGRTAGSFTITFGGQTSSSITVSGVWGPMATSTDVLQITPTSDFDGTIVISIKAITGPSMPHVVFTNSSGATIFAIRGGNLNSNMFVGVNSGCYNTTGYYNTFLGAYAGYDNTTGYNNTFLGYRSGYYNTTGYSNTFLGVYSGYSNTTGHTNIFLGVYTGYYNTTGHTNTFLGTYSGRYNTTGYDNTFLGAYAGYNNTTGYSNTFVGRETGRTISTGYYNTFIGFHAGYNSNQLATAANSMGLGYGAFTTRDNQIVIGNHSIVETQLRANVYIGSKSSTSHTQPTAQLHIAAGSASANTAPLKFTSGTLLTTPEVGAIEFNNDDFYATITTGAARKGFVLNNGSNLTPGKIPIATTNGRLTDGPTPLSGTKVYYVADSSGGAVTRKLTFIDGILVSET